MFKICVSSHIREFQEKWNQQQNCNIIWTELNDFSDSLQQVSINSLSVFLVHQKLHHNLFFLF